MDEYNIHKIMIEQYARRLYTTAGKISQDFNNCCKKRKPNMKRLKSEIQTIKDLIATIEIELDNF